MGRFSTLTANGLDKRMGKAHIRYLAQAIKHAPPAQAGETGKARKGNRIMANKHVRLDGSVFTYIVQPKDDAKGQAEVGATLDLDKVPNLEFSALGQIAKDAVIFAFTHMFRNATAGKMEKPEDAVKPIETRIKALMDGKFRAHREGGEMGESEHSQLARALGIVMGVEPSDAAAFIVEQVNAALEENGIDPDADAETMSAEDKSKRRKVAAAVRKQIGDDPAVSIEVQKIRLAENTAKLEAATKDATGKVSKFTPAPK